MTSSSYSHSVDAAFFEPVNALLALCTPAQPHLRYSDADFIRAGMQRVLESCQSGRAFLQEHGPRLPSVPSRSNYFSMLHSARRRFLLLELAELVQAQANQNLPDRLASIPELSHYECFAADGHWHGGATHDPRDRGRKMSVGHFYSLNLRTQTLRHLAVGEGFHEHDMHALKRVKPIGLRQGVPKGERVIIVYDKAGIDFHYWKRCRQECAVYFISRVKEKMILEWEETREWDREDGRNQGVWEDVRVRTREGLSLRIVCYLDPVTGKRFEFLTNEMDLPPGVVVELYRRRWEAEKVFDEVKNKLEERKAWATSEVAREVQALFIVLTHNRLLEYEEELRRKHGVKNDPEDRRREERRKASGNSEGEPEKKVSTLVLQALHATQRSVKFIRWLRQSMRDGVAEATAVLRLRALYASL